MIPFILTPGTCGKIVESILVALPEVALAGERMPLWESIHG